MSNLQDPLISVIIACHNSQEWVENAIQSVLGQTYPNFEIIVVDDGSDDTSNVVQKYPVTYVHLDDRGAANCFNRGIDMSHGEYFVKLDADDALESNYIEKTIKPMLDDNRVGFVYTGKRMFGAASTIKITRTFSRWKLLHHNYVNPAALVRRRAFDKNTGYDSDLPSCEDWDLWITLAFNGWTGKAVFEPLHLYRVHSRKQHISRDSTRNNNVKAFRMLVKKRRMIYGIFAIGLILTQLTNKLLHPRRHLRGDVVSRDRYIIRSLIGWVFRRPIS